MIVLIVLHRSVLQFMIILINSHVFNKSLMTNIKTDEFLPRAFSLFYKKKFSLYSKCTLLLSGLLIMTKQK